MRIFVLLLCVATLGLLCCACSNNNNDSGVITISNVESRNTITNASEDRTVHYSESKNSFTEKAASSGLIELYIDSKTNSFGIYDTSLDQLWSTLPLLDSLTQGEALLSNASMASLKVIGGTDVYYLNTQDNSVDYGKASYQLIDGGVEFTFDIFSDRKTAEKTAYSKTDIGFNVTMKVTLADGSMVVDCKYKNLTGNPDACIESIDLLNSFGAYNDTQEDDFLLVPDGSGAIIKTSVYDESFEALSFAVYGNDPSTDSESDGTAVIPAFGIKHGNSAFVSLIQKGDAVATVNAEKAKSLSEYNRVYSSFSVTPVIYSDETLYISKTASVDEISLCYRFLSGNNATYAGLASACREQLIRNSVLSTNTVIEGSYLPFFLTVTGAATESFGPIEYTAQMTAFEQTQDMLSRMKSKGINNVNVRYVGVFTGGVNSRDIAGARLLGRIGGTEGLSELYDYVTTQKMNLFIDINLLSSASGFSSRSAVNLQKKSGEYMPLVSQADYMGTGISQRNYRSLDSLKKIVSSVLADSRSFSFSGFCLNDAGSLLYSDFSTNGYLRQDAADMIKASIASLSTGHKTMAVNGNFYMLKNIDTIVNLPLSAKAANSGAYVSVPFVQLVLHGIVDYAGDPINTETNLEETLLKHVEYGACPHFAWNYESEGVEENDVYYYDNTINTAAEFYTQANELLSDLRSARITDHYEVQDGVFCTEYDTGAMIYVNYTDNDCSTHGIVIEAGSYFRVN